MDTENPAASLGSAVHKAIEEYIERGHFDADAICREYAVEDREDFRFLTERAMWHYDGADNAIARYLGKPAPEAKLQAEVAPGVILTGTPDIVSLDETGEVAITVDWKTGRNREDVAHQIRGQMLLAIRTYGVKKVVGYVVWLRDGVVDMWESDAESMQAWCDDVIVGGIVRNRTVYRPGRACLYCPCNTTCDAKDAHTRAAIRAFADDPEQADRLALLLSNPKQVVGAQYRLGDLWDRMKLVKRACEDIERAAKDAAKQREHGLSLLNGRRLLASESKRREVDVRKAWPILREHIADDALSRCVSVKLTALGQELGKNKRAVLDELDSIGAIDYTETVTVREVPEVGA